MPDSYTEVTEQSWMGRLFSSIKSVLVGIVLFLLAFPVLFWNEGRAVHSARSLEEGAAVVVSVPADAVNPSNDGKLVHVTGEATTTETLVDPDFGLSASAIRLERVVQMYQWEERKSSESRTKLGGGQETVTTYNYGKVWSSRLIDSSQFKEPGEHSNPRAMPVTAEAWTARKVTLGGFTLSGAEVGKLSHVETIAIDDAAARQLPEAMKPRAKVDGGGYFLGPDPAAPAVGDVKVTFQAARPATISLIARQVGNSFEPYQAKAGKSLDMLSYGMVAADSMFKSAELNNELVAWILRAAGLLTMMIGLYLIFRPIAVLGDVVPLFGSLLAGGIGLACFLLAGCLSLVTIAIGWINYRPVVGIGLLVAAAAAGFGMKKMARKRPA